MNSEFVGIDHVQVLMPPGSESTARSFWCDVIGLPEVEKPIELQRRGGIWLRCGAQGIHVGVEPNFTPALRAHPALRLATAAAYDSLVERLTAAGVAIEHAKLPIADRRMKIHDPFGNLIEFVLGTTG